VDHNMISKSEKRYALQTPVYTKGRKFDLFCLNYGTVTQNMLLSCCMFYTGQVGHERNG